MKRIISVLLLAAFAFLVHLSLADMPVGSSITGSHLKVVTPGRNYFAVQDFIYAGTKADTFVIELPRGTDYIGFSAIFRPTAGTDNFDSVGMKSRIIPAFGDGIYADTVAGSPFKYAQIDTGSVARKWLPMKGTTADFTPVAGSLYYGVFDTTGVGIGKYLEVIISNGTTGWAAYAASNPDSLYYWIEIVMTGGGGGAK